MSQLLDTFLKLIISNSSDKTEDKRLRTDAVLTWYLQCLVTRFEFILLSTLGNEKYESCGGDTMAVDHTHYITLRGQIGLCVCMCV